MVGLPPEQLDDWLPDPALRVAHRMSSPASPAELWRSARALTLSQSPVLGRLVQWRIPGTARELTFDALLREPPFLVLAEDERWLLSGLVGRIWTLRRDYPALPDPASFRGFAQRGSARVAIGVWAEDDPRGGAPARHRLPAPDRLRGAACGRPARRGPRGVNGRRVG